MTTIDQLDVLVAIAETGSQAAAARTLHLSQPTVFHHLAALEANLGGRLVDRSPSGSRLTELGALALPQARAILEGVSNIERDLRTFVEHGLAVVNVGSFPSAAAVLLARPLASLHQLGLPFRLFVAEPPEIAARFGDHALDVALLLSEPYAPPPAPEWLESEALFDDPLLVLLPPGHRLQAQREVELRDLVDEPWITTTSDTSPEYTLLMRAYAELGRQPRFTIRTIDFHVNQKLVAAGLGLSLIPEMLAEQFASGCVARRVADPRFARRIHIAWRQNRPPAVLALVTDVRREATRLREHVTASSA